MLATRARPAAVPPPVPPRPSKTLVAAALARTRAVGLVPTRRAPPPPVGDIENLPPKPCELKRTHFTDKNERLALRDNVNNAPDPSVVGLKVRETNGETRKSAVHATLAVNEQKQRPSPHNVGYDHGTRTSVIPAREVDEPTGAAGHDEPGASPETHKLSVHVSGPSRRPSYVLPTGQHRHTEVTAAASRQDRLVHELVRELKETSEQRVASCCRMAAAGSSSALQGLPPLPKSLSGANLVLPEASAGAVYGRQLPVVPPARGGGGGRQQPQPILAIQQRGPPAPPPHRKTPTGLDAQLAVLRNEMFGLRQLDLSLLSQLWSLNESIQEFRQLLQEQDDRSPPSPSSAEEGEEFYSPLPPSRYPPLKSVPEQYRLSSSSSGSSIEYGDV